MELFHLGQLEFLDKLETAERASIEKSSKMRNYWQYQRERMNNISNNPPEIMKTIRRAMRGTRSIFGRDNISSLCRYVQRKAGKKKSRKIGVKKIKNIENVI